MCDGRKWAAPFLTNNIAAFIEIVAFSSNLYLKCLLQNLNREICAKMSKTLKKKLICHTIPLTKKKLQDALKNIIHFKFNNK